MEEKSLEKEGVKENKENINLESKSWYRALKVLGIGFLILAFFEPLLSDKNYDSSVWIVDGLVNVIIWWIVLLILKKILIYVIVGKNNSNQKINHFPTLTRKLSIDKILVRKLVKGLSIVIIVFIIISMILLYLPIFKN
jgi:hypothetical protein